MQRVRIGLTGLALVFILVLIGAVIRSASDDGSVAGNGLARTAAADGGNAQDDHPTEALAELGVAPGNADPNAESTSAAASKN